MHVMHEQSALYGRSAEVIAEKCRVDVSTARRWKKGSSAIPYSANALMEGDLGALDRAWVGWRIIDGKLISPEQLVATPGEVRAIPFKDILIGSLREDARQLKEALEKEKGLAITNQPEPEEWGAVVAQLRMVAV